MKTYLKTFCFVLAACFFVSSALRCEVLQMQSGEELNAEVKSADSKFVILKGGKRLPRSAVKFIRFSDKKGVKKAESADYSPALKERAKELFGRAEELKKLYPSGDAFILDDTGEYLYRKDGTRRTRTRYAVMILKENLKNVFGDVIAYEQKGRTSAKIEEATVFCPDGGIYPLEPENIRMTEPQSAESFYSAGGRYLTYSLPNLEVGCIADYTLVVENYNPYEKDFFFPYWNFQGRFPVYKSYVKVRVPKERSIYYAARNFKGKFKKLSRPKVSQKKGFRIYEWNVDKAPPVIPEPSMPPLGELTMHIKASLFEDWGPIFDWTNKLYRERINAARQLRDFTLDLIKDCKTDEEKVAKIYHYVQREIRYIAVKIGIASGMGGYDANLTWKRKWGCCVDKALLLTAMLKVAGIDSSPIDIRTNNETKLDFRIPSLSFNHAISVVNLPGKKVFLDSTNYDYRYPQIAAFNYGVNVLNVFARKIDYIPLPLPRENGSFYDYKIVVSSDNRLSVSETLNYTGSREAELKSYYRTIKKKERRLVFERMIKSVSPKARLEEYKINNAEVLEKPFSMAMKYTADEYMQKAGDIFIFPIPDFEMGKWEMSPFSLEKRKYPVQYSVSMGKYYDYEIKLPVGWEIISMPKKTRIKNKHASFFMMCRKEGQAKLKCRKKFERFSRVIPAKDYKEYKKFLRKVARYSKENIFLRGQKRAAEYK